MPIFDELMDRQKLETPEQRSAAELERSSKNFKRSKHANRTSVTARRYYWSMKILVLTSALLILSGAGYLIYILVQSYLAE